MTNLRVCFCQATSFLHIWAVESLDLVVEGQANLIISLFFKWQYTGRPIFPYRVFELAHQKTVSFYCRCFLHERSIYRYLGPVSRRCQENRNLECIWIDLTDIGFWTCMGDRLSRCLWRFSVGRRCIRHCLCCDTGRFCVIKRRWVDGCGGHARIRTGVGQSCSECNGPKSSISLQAILETNDSTSLATIRISNWNLPRWTYFNDKLRVGLNLRLWGQSRLACPLTQTRYHTPHRGAA